MPSVDRTGGDETRRFLFPGQLDNSQSGPSSVLLLDVTRERRFKAGYVGCCELEPRYSVKDLTEAVDQLSQVSSVCISVTIEVVTGCIITYSQDGAEMFCHPIREIQRLAGTQTNKAGILYVHRTKINNVKPGPGYSTRLILCFRGISQPTSAISSSWIPPTW